MSYWFRPMLTTGVTLLRYLLLEVSALLQGERELLRRAAALYFGGLEFQLQLVYFALQIRGQLLPQREVRVQQEDLGMETLEFLFPEYRLVWALVLSLQQVRVCGDRFNEGYQWGTLVMKLQQQRHC